MKYEFIKVDEDTTTLKYKDKEFTIKRDIELISKVQDVYNRAKTKMFIDLTKQGIKKDDLIITTKKDGKLYQDNTNLLELENQYVQTEQALLFQDITKDMIGMGLDELMLDIGLEENEMEHFGMKFGEALLGKSSPSKK